MGGLIGSALTAPDLEKSPFLVSSPDHFTPVGVSDRGVLNRLVNLFCVLPIRMVMQRDTRFILVQAIEALRPV